MTNYCGFLFVFLSLCTRSFGEFEVIVIGRPEIQCRENGDVIEIESETTKIRLPENTPALYSVNTERAANCVDQGCILMTWKIIRDFEMYLNGKYNSTGISGVIQFRNDMLIIGFNYLLHVTLKKTGGQIEEKDYNITFFNEKDRPNTLKLHGSLDLNIGSNHLYAPLPLIINANATVCGDSQYYYFRWSMTLNNQNAIKLPDKNSELMVLTPSMLTNNEDTYIIHCQIMDYESNISILEKSLNLYIIASPEELNNDILQVVLPFTYTTINKGAPISILPYIYSSKNLEYKMEWSCILENTLLYGCQGQLNMEFYMETGFSQEGNYSITLTVRTKDMENSATCNILVLQDVPSIAFDLPGSIRPEKGIEIIAKISELRTYCTVQWFGDQDNQIKLEDIPGLTTTIYNISSKDRTFLEEMMEFGSMTITKKFKFKIPPPSRTWTGLKTKNYYLRIAVTCPSNPEIIDVTEFKDQPKDFITITAKTEFFVPPLPSVESLDVISENDKALLSEYFYTVHKTESEINNPMVYKHGFILDGLEVVFYSGIDVFSARTNLPYNEDFGIYTFVEVCDYKKRCGKKFGPLVKPSINYNLDEKTILKTFKQKLIEENFYKVFSYAFIILHSSKYLNQSQKYSSLFSLEISAKLEKILEREDKTLVFNDLIRNLVIFIDRLTISDELMNQISLLTHEFLNNSPYHNRIARHSSRIILSFSDGDQRKLEEMQNYLKTSEHFILNSVKIEAVGREKDHMINLLEKWMVLACNLIFKGERVLNVEMRTMVFAIEKFSHINKLITVPFDNNDWNLTAHLKISNLTPHNDICLGHVMLKNFFGNQDVTFGSNIYSGDYQQIINTSARISILLPFQKSPTVAQCVVYKNGWNNYCSTTKYYTNFVECICPSFGYYFLDTRNKTYEDKREEFLNITENSNNTSDEYDTIKYKKARRLGEQISYVIIVSSLVGFLILCYIIRKLTIYPQQNITMDGFGDSYQYGTVMHEDLLD